MMHRSCVAFLFFAAVAPSHSAAIDAKHSDSTLALQPPENSAHDIEVSLAAIMKSEHEKRELSDSAFETAKQRMINVEKQRLHDIVQNAFAVA